ncbi:helix-turn-helix domain-containing protein [Thermoflavimicrobium dichotomicum]|uniref:Helix-turn-helix n=1 Tax=Thermoflavimicrobium dichotomicum TaxID=46223 RepID=A0A1I3T852_9BACL|nr:helix-turn-helix transcriptional regulator [Thermoflavimicrobium dichotomicum]SFJ65971.1 Helix-turn-helix [Thermoflavimicrobium dichotomicum]
MNESTILNSKTTLEYLVLINKKSYSQIGRELGITPQQFSDWIKKRRPIPQERLKALCEYFGLESHYLVDERNFARSLNPITKIDIETLLVKRVIEKGEEDPIPYQEKLTKLERERAKQVRLGRLASILHQESDQIDHVIDTFLDQLESGNIERLKRLLTES